MAFDPAKFMKDKFENRTAQVSVIGLAYWFGLTDGEFGPWKPNFWIGIAPIWDGLGDPPKLTGCLDDEQPTWSREMPQWHGRGRPPLWTVRGQTANEVAFILEAKEKKYKNVDAIIKAIGSNADQINDLKAAIGVDYKTTPDEIVKRLEQLVQCSVEPTIKMDVAVKLAQTRPIEFFQLTNEITRLTGMGMDLKKPLASGAQESSEA